MNAHPLHAPNRSVARTVFAACLWLLVGGLPVAAADILAPDALVRSVSEEVLRIARDDRSAGAPDRERVERLIEEKIAPHFDFPRITRLATGPSWREATASQRERLTAAFRRMLIRTYSAAYRGYRDIALEVKPVTLAPEDTETLVRTNIKLPENPTPLQVDYSMARTPGGWKVYDVAVAGASLVTTYRSSFREKIQAGGIDRLITDLEAVASAGPRRTP